MEENIRETINRLFRQKSQMRDIGESDKFFDLGVSSLTIIELQIGIERELRITVPTGELMRLGTIKDWIGAYSARARHRSIPSAANAPTTHL